MGILPKRFSCLVDPLNTMLAGKIISLPFWLPAAFEIVHWLILAGAVK